MSRAKVGDITRRGLTVVEARQAGDEHQVVSVQGEFTGYMKQPCRLCPWRVDATGEFPAEAFQHSARTAHDMSEHVFACHESGINVGKTCAGFLLRGAYHNMSVRLGCMTGKYKQDVRDGGHELYESYIDMAVGNGVDPDDESLKECRS
jgi:hypothetical protein